MQSTPTTGEIFHSSWLILQVVVVVSLETEQAPKGAILTRYVIIEWKSCSLDTGRIQFKVLITLPLQFKGF